MKNIEESSLEQTQHCLSSPISKNILIAFNIMQIIFMTLPTSTILKRGGKKPSYLIFIAWLAAELSL